MIKSNKKAGFKRWVSLGALTLGLTFGGLSTNPQPTSLPGGAEAEVSQNYEQTGLTSLTETSMSQGLLRWGVSIQPCV
jgi:hypothetical protein